MSVVIPTCKTCKSRFKYKRSVGIRKIECFICKCRLCYDCAIYSDDNNTELVCENCYKGTIISEDNLRKIKETISINEPCFNGELEKGITIYAWGRKIN